MIKLKLTGLTDAQAEITKSARNLAIGLPKLERELAADMASLARRKARQGSRTGRAMRSIQVTRSTISAGTGIEYYGFFDFGGRVGRNRSIVRKYIRGGRYLFPAMQKIGIRRQAEMAAEKAVRNLR